MRVLLIDAPGMIYRGHFALQRNPLRAPDGRVTSGLFHLFEETCNYIDRYEPDMVALVFDFPAPTFRSDIYADYKANRPPTPDEIKEQSRLARELCATLGLPCLENEGLEADDIIAVLTREALSSDGESSVLIVSSDKDLLQLLDEDGRVTVLQPGRPGRAAREVCYGDVPELLGVRASQVVDYLSLSGDSSDNIPGAQGIGPKTAAGLLSQFEGLDDIYEHIEEVEARGAREKLVRSADAVELSRRLVKLSEETIPGLSLAGLERGDPDPETAPNALAELGFRKLAERFGVAIADDLNSPSGEAISIVLDRRKLTDLEKKLDSSCGEILALDTETDSQDPIEATPVGFSVTCDGESAWYVPVGHPDSSLTVDEIRLFLDGLSERYGLVAQNAKYDLHVLSRMGVSWRRLSGDPYLAHYLLEPVSGGHGLSAMAAEYLGMKVQSYRELLGGQESLAALALDEVARYCGTDSIAAIRLHEMLTGRLEEEGLLELYRDVELPVAEILTRMEARGVRLDRDALRDLEGIFSLEMAEIERGARDRVGFSVNLNSPAQVSHVLFEVLGLPVIRKTSRGAASSSMEVLQTLSGRDPFVDLVIEYRELSKLLSTYVQRLPDYVSPSTGLIHTSFNQGVASTGRLSSSSPNLQNIPIRTERGRMVRRCFRPAEERHVFISSDYSQIELRVLAHLSGDPTLTHAYENDMDIHAATSEAVFGRVDPDCRRKAKEINFSIVYGISPHGLSMRLGVPYDEAAGIIDRYFENYPGVKEYFESCVKQTEEKGEARTILNRKRPFPELASSKGSERKALERIAVNSTVQGSAADIVKLAMIRVDRRLEKDAPSSGLVLQVHDELVIAAPESEADEVAVLVREEMERAFDLSVPLRVETGTGSNWLEAQH